jgi:hypothetical protein
MFRDPARWPLLEVPRQPPAPLAAPVAADVAAELDELAARVGAQALLLMMVIARHHARPHAPRAQLSHPVPETPRVCSTCPVAPQFESV